MIDIAPQKNRREQYCLISITALCRKYNQYTKQSHLLALALLQGLCAMICRVNEELMSRNETDANALAGNMSQNAPARILVTGGAGFIGSHLVDAVLSWFPSTQVTVLDALTYAANPGNLREARASGRMRLVHGSVEDRETLQPLIHPDMLILHLAAETHVPRSFADPALFDRVNRGGTRILLEAAIAGKAQRVVHFSTDEVYGSRLFPADETAPLAPTSPYARSKAEAECEVEAARARGLDLTVLRPSNVVGPRQHREKLVPRFIVLAKAGKPFPLEGDGRQQRTFLAVSDLARAVKVILDRGPKNATYNVAGSQTLSVMEVACLIAAVLDRRCQFVHVGDRPNNDRAYMLDGTRLAALGFQPGKQLHEAVQEIVAGELTGHSPRPLLPLDASLPAWSSPRPEAVMRDGTRAEAWRRP
ncbi:NAD-dependent epimerase/dehydratase family protein [Mesorhizobium sp. NBSH29]|uniref:NAD-dependent epimerase/dehydratase family protein n=1 Tax=Mesorhizobium sp. NBSH29 TaxID=2654249 RepID=UPI0018964E38|nr:NAD-dependent epimerase/dehydratase family protein [Mesorhizobium sp. NBSH29]